MKSRIAAVVVPLLLSMLGLAAPANATFPGANGKIAYTDAGCVFQVNPDGSSSTPAAPCPSSFFIAVEPAWAADGHRLAYGNGYSGEVVYVTDGAAPTFVVGTPSLPFSLGWSPDGARLVVGDQGCFADSGCVESLFSVRADGSARSTIQVDSTTERFYLGADWSPDGTKIVFDHGGLAYGAALYTVNPDGTGLTFIADDAHNPSWSPDGTHLAFDRGGDVWTVSADGSSQARLTNAPGPDENPVWSPDGTKIAFASARDDQDAAGCAAARGCKFDIYVMNANGDGQTNITNTPQRSEGQPTWQPLPGPQRSDYKNAAQFCKAERDFLSDAAFAQKYGTNGNAANAYGKCVSQSH